MVSSTKQLKLENRNKNKLEIINARKQLPIYNAKDALIDEINNNQVLIIMGETGSGKTTQIPQFLLEAGYASKGLIAITQPRRVAAISIATRVSHELSCKLGSTVGYSIRFDDCTTPETKIKYMTDGMLMREFLNDMYLTKYSCIILDECHERTLRTDILLGLVKRVLKKRKNDLKVILMSATLDADRFSIFFNNAKVLYVAGRQFPVTTYHTETKQEDPLDAALVSIIQIHRENPYSPNSDILVFLTGQEEIESAAKILKEASQQLPPNEPGLLITPIFASLPTAQQQKVFEKTPHGMRKVVLSTNIAETSITIPGIKFVIDTGLVKVRSYNPKIGLETLGIQPISQASADQRTGRAGREAPGICYRLYTEAAFQELDHTTEPEIMRCNLASVILLLKASGIEDIFNFDYFDRPDRASLGSAMEQLYALGALGDDGKLSEKGKEMSCFPIEPSFAKVLISSKEYKCTKDLINIIACLSVDSLFYSSYEKREQVSEAIKKFLSYDGDHLTLLNVVKGYHSVRGDPSWCTENWIKARSMKQIMDVRKQLIRLCQQVGMLPKNEDDEEGDMEDSEASLGGMSNYENIVKCFLTGFFQNVAFLQPDGTSYKVLASNQLVHIHPSSVLFGKKCKAVFFNELVHTSKKYMRNVTQIQPAWVIEVSSHYYGRNRKE